MINNDVIVVGCARNIEKYLDNTLNKINIIKELFKSTNVIIFENDSTDNTLNILRYNDSITYNNILISKDLSKSMLKYLIISSSEIISPLILILSLNSKIWGEVYKPTLYPLSLNIDAKELVTLPLPLVPAT
jgi:hypothetical protein